MDTDYSATQARYSDFLSRTPEIINQTLLGVVDDAGTQLHEIISSKKRLLFTGTGSSMPATWYGAHTMLQAGYPAQFLPTGAILGLQSLTKDDAVILSSQGINRADALLVIKKVTESPANLIVLTANRAYNFEGKAAACFYFEPSEEKLFCRPAGVAANYALMAKLLRTCTHDTSIDQQLITAWQQGRKNPLKLPHGCSRYIVLSSDAMMPVAWNTALALREGSGLLTQLFDIETYAHGNYVSDLYNREHGISFGYIFVSANNSAESARSVRRFTPFAEAAHIPYIILTSEYDDPAQAGLYVLASVSAQVFALNEMSGYNMNRPPGKEENRYYHELESYDV